MMFLDENYLLKGKTSRDLYKNVKDLPIVDPHNHANVKEIADNKNYPNPWQLFAATDHYVWEVLRKRNVEEKFLTGDAPPKQKWLRMASVFPELAGNPVYEWIHLDLKRYLGIEEILGPGTGLVIWEKASEVLAKNEKKPQALLNEIGVEVMCSTDDPVDLLEDHKRVNNSMGRTVLRPTWRPDKAMNIFSSNWKPYVGRLEQRFSMKIKSVKELVTALRLSHHYFADNGCKASDHGVEIPYAGDAKLGDAEAVFKIAMSGKQPTCEQCGAFMSYMLGEMAEMDSEKGWVFQLHIGAVRDVRKSLFEGIGPDSGGDVSNHNLDIHSPLKKFLNRFDNRLKITLYCLEAGHQATLATLTRAFGANVNLGSAWWLCDTPVGMRRQLEYIGSVDVFANFAGMVSDSRKLLSYGSRFEMFRRIFCDVIGEMVDYGQIPVPVAGKLTERVCYSGPKEFYNL
ncbi:MAG TPA: glucuronate isomerase [Lentisphaeria bacterium]|nr:glucuronate isomerase [Lentisphaeria bacterium]